MIGIIGAMKEETDALVALMNVEKETDVLTYHFYQGKLGQADAVVVQGGIGKVNAAISATTLLNDFDIDHLINIGTAGGLLEQENVGDIIVGKEVVHHDFDLLGFGRPYGQVPDLPFPFKADEEMVRLCEEALADINVPHHAGLIASGDQFVCRQEQVDAIMSHFPESMCCEMEAASIAQVATVFGVPFIITRGLSDIFGKGDNGIQFDDYIHQAAASSAKMCYELAQKL